ncbi:hypothetical protein BKA93DRAFT_829540 [Sparassis latifolia]
MEYSHCLSACLQALDCEAPFDAPPYASMYSEGPISFGVTSSPAPHGSPDSTMSSDSVDIGASFAFYTPSVVSAGSMLGLMTPFGSSLTFPEVPNYLDNDIFGNLDSTSPRGRPFVGDTFLGQPVDGYDSFLGNPSRLGGRIHSPYSPSLRTSDHHHGGADDYHNAHNGPSSPSNYSASFSEHSSVTSPAEVLSPISALSLPPLPVTRASRAKAANATAQQQAHDSEEDADGSSEDSGSSDEYVPSLKASSSSRGVPRRRGTLTRNTRQHAPYARSTSSALAGPSSPSALSSSPSTPLRRVAARNKQIAGPVRLPRQGETKCEYCEEEIPRFTDLKRHVLTHSPAARRYVCGGLPRAAAIRAGVNVEARLPYVYGGVAFYVGSLTAPYNLERPHEE